MTDTRHCSSDLSSAYLYVKKCGSMSSAGPVVGLPQSKKSWFSLVSVEPEDRYFVAIDGYLNFRCTKYDHFQAITMLKTKAVGLTTTLKIQKGPRKGQR